MKQSGDKGRLLEQVVLGYADGDMAPAEDTDPFACKLGGQALWLDETSAIPERSVSVCGQCGADMVLLAQAYVPLTGSPYDRVLYVWCCNRRACTGRPGAARAIRGHLLNREYALSLIQEKKKRKAPTPKEADSKNRSASLFCGTAFTQSKSTAPVFDFGSVWNTKGDKPDELQAKTLFSGPLFGGISEETHRKPAKQEQHDPQHDPNVQSMDSAEPKADKVLHSLQERVSGLAISSTPAAERVEWPESRVCVPPQYLAFEGEELDDTRTLKRYEAEIKQAQAMIADLNDSKTPAHKKGKQSSAAASGSAEANEEWAGEKYERTVRPKGTDAAFEHFANITGQNPSQVMRYQFNGLPLFYSLLDDTARLLNPPRQRADARNIGSEVMKSGKDDEDSEDDEDDEDDEDGDGSALLHGYSTEKIPRCPRCNGRRVFECQLMPAILSILPLSRHVPESPASALGKAKAQEASSERLTGSRLLDSLDLGMEFGTMLVFACENDCHEGKTGIQHISQGAGSLDQYACATYYEELVLVQLESHVD
ncbi:hypothetical protein GGI12_000523 [Dipsacomyces acuminosporus]|nr:hypothetical protein GGI12_000523 [Dipsacomyces acuminosporus]